MKENIIYDEWIPYIDYEKVECDVKLKDGTIVYHCWPNAGKFNPLCSNMDEVMEEDVVEIMYRKYYVQDLCKANCNGDGGELKNLIRHVKNGPDAYSQDSFIDYKTLSDDMWSNFFPTYERIPQFIRTEPKIGRNELCKCNSGKKYKKCCL